ncbi:hypothetical protein T492DRAFT_620577, partial [Pavlovales sp. CCMP2436]
MEANKEDADLALERAREAMREPPLNERAMSLLCKAERMFASDEVRKVKAEWTVICEVYAHRDNPRALFGLGAVATEEELNTARKRLALRVHPDKNSAPHADEAFKIVQAAFIELKTALSSQAAPRLQGQHAQHAPSREQPPGVMVVCCFCNGSLDVKVPADNLRPAAQMGASKWRFRPFAAQCCYCQTVIYVHDSTFSAVYHSAPSLDIAAAPPPPP